MSIEEGPKLETAEEARPKKRGCLFYGGVIVLTLSIVTAVGLYATYRLAKNAVGDLVDKYSSTEPASLPEVAVPAGEGSELRERVERFADAVREGTSTEPLALSADDLNAIVLGLDDEIDLAGRVHFSIEEDELRGEVSLPLDEVGFPGRYFNGTASFHVSLENGVLLVTLRSASVRGEPLPEWLMTELSQKNLAADVYEDPENAEFLRKLERIEIRDGRIHVIGRSLSSMAALRSSGVQELPGGFSTEIKKR